MKPAYLGIDIGTSGVRGCCIDDSKTEIASFSVVSEITDISEGR